MCVCEEYDAAIWEMVVGDNAYLSSQAVKVNSIFHLHWDAAFGFILGLK